jgi:hypothetical protein
VRPVEEAASAVVEEEDVVPVLEKYFDFAVVFPWTIWARNRCNIFKIDLLYKSILR